MRTSKAGGWEVLEEAGRCGVRVEVGAPQR